MGSYGLLVKRAAIAKLRNENSTFSEQFKDLDRQKSVGTYSSPYKQTN
jgi:hypothetical protein